MTTLLVIGRITTVALLATLAITFMPSAFATSSTPLISQPVRSVPPQFLLAQQQPKPQPAQPQQPKPGTNEVTIDVTPVIHPIEWVEKKVCETVTKWVVKKVCKMVVEYVNNQKQTKQVCAEERFPVTEQQCKIIKVQKKPPS